MEFGIFYQLPCAPDQSPVARYDDMIAQVQLADELGFDTAWLAELHFNPRFSILSAPLLVASAIARTTRRIRIGTAVNLVPLHHPIRLAEETATLDILSRGRAIFGIGRGAIPSHFEGYGVPLDEGRARFQEAVDLILKAWTTDELTYHSEYYQVQGVQVVPKPHQKPHPPVYVASNSPDTFPLIGSMGHNILVAPLIVSNQRAREGLEVYRRTLKEHGRNPQEFKVTVTIPTYVTDDRKKARTGPEASINNYLNTLRTGRGRGAERAMTLTYDQIYEEFAAIGDPEHCAARLKHFQDMFGASEIMCWFNNGGLLPHAEVEKSMRLFAQEVMPLFR